MVKKILDFIKEVRVEFTKVTWPTRVELTGSTTVVIIVSLLVAIFIGTIDLILARIVTLVLK